MFKFKRRTTIEARDTLDLRTYTPEALRGIKAIDAVGVIILPENPDNNFMQAFSAIHCSAVGTVIYLPKSTKLIPYTGTQKIDTLRVEENSVAYMCGNVLIGDSVGCPDCMFCGIVVKNKKADVNILGGVVGIMFETEFDENKVSFFTTSTTIDSDFIRNIEDGTFIFCGNNLEIADSVTEEEITSKKLKFFAGNTLTCNKKILGCIQGRALTGNKTVAK